MIRYTLAWIHEAFWNPLTPIGKTIYIILALTAAALIILAIIGY